MFDLLSKGHIKAHIYKVYDLKDTAQAHKDITSRKTTGKLLLKPSEPVSAEQTSSEMMCNKHAIIYVEKITLLAVILVHKESIQ